jgi:molybdopterin-guanine dinucleotide biosynthesis protein A
VSITAIILAGGKATRMGGVDKGQVLFQQKPLITHVVTRLVPQVDEILINANREIETYKTLGYQILQDEITDFAGPLAGMQLGLKYASSDYLLTVPCDSPLLPLDLAERLQIALIKYHADIAIVMSNGNVHPVFCLCKRSVLPILNDYLDHGGRKVREWQQSLNHVHVDCSDCAEAFTNLNTQQDLTDFEAKLQKILPGNSSHDCK